MAMDSDDILRRLVTGAEFIEQSDITPKQRERAKARYDELEAEYYRLIELEKSYKPPVPEVVQEQMDLIRGILQPSKDKRG